MGGVIAKRGGVLATPAAVNGNFMLALKDCIEHDVEMGGRMGACQTRDYVRNFSTNTGPFSVWPSSISVYVRTGRWGRKTWLN